MEPVKVEFFMRDNLTPGLEKAGKSAEALGEKAGQVSKSITDRISAQKEQIKYVESCLKDLKKQYDKLAPSKGQLEMKAEIDACTKALQDDKNILASLEAEHNKTTASTKRLSMQLREMQNAMALMRLEGKENTKEYADMAQKAATLSDTIGDLRAQTNILAHDNAALQGVIGGVNGLSGMFTVATGAMGVFAAENENLAKIQTRVQSVMAVTMGLQQVMNTLNKDSAFRLVTVVKMKNLLTAANTRLATSLGVSTTAAKVLMGSGIGLLVTGIISLISYYNRLNQAKKENREISRQAVKETQDELVKAQSLERVLKDSTQSYDTRKRALNELKQIMPSYNAMLNKEGTLIEDNTGSLKRYAEQLKNTALAKIYSEKLAAEEVAYSEWLNGLTNREQDILLTRGFNLKKEDEFVYNVLNAKLKEYQGKISEYRKNLDRAVTGQLSNTSDKPKGIEPDKTKVSDLTELEVKARRKIEENTVALMKEGYERQRKEAELAFAREKERIADEEKQRLELYEKLRKAGQPVTKTQKDAISTQADEQARQAKDIYDRSLAGINAKEKLELEKQEKVIKEALAKYQTYYQKRLAVIARYQKDRENLKKGDATEGQYAELDYQKEKALSEIDQAFAMREDSFKVWADSIVNLSLEQLRKLLYQAQQELQRMEFLNPTGDLSSYRQRIVELEKVIADFNKKNDKTPAEGSFKQWSRLSNVLNHAAKDFKEIGDAVGGTAGEILTAAGEITTSTLSMISSIAELANWSVTSTKMASEGASKAIQAVEKASIILAVISAAIQLLTQLQSLIPDAHDEYLNYAAKVNEINILRDAVQEYELAVIKARQAEESWFASNSLNVLKHAKEVNEQIYEAYIAKVSEAQAVYQNEGGGGWLTAIWKPINWLIDNTYGKLYGFNILRDYKEGTTAAVNNLHIETRKASSGFLGTGIGGKSQKTEDLQAWINSNKDAFKKLGVNNTNLFDSQGMINKELAQSLIDNYGGKLVGQTKETLEALVELKERYDECLEQLHEYVSSLYEPLVDNFVNSLWDWLDEGKDALDSFKDYASQTFRDIVSDMMRTIVLEKVFGSGENSFQEQLNNLYEDYASGKIKTETELAAQVSKLTAGLIGQYESALPGLQNIMKSITESLAKAGIDLKDTEAAYGQSGRAGAITTITQDTGNKLEGIGTSMQMHLANMDKTVENIGSALGSALASLLKIEEYTGQSSKTLAEIKIYVERILLEGLFMK